MRKITIQIMILIIGIMLSIAGFLGVKKYFDRAHSKKGEYVLAYNNYMEYTDSMNFIVPIEKEEATTTTTTTTSTTTMKTTTTTKQPEEEKKEEESVPTISDDGSIIYDGLTLTALTDKLNRNLSSTLTNTGIYFAKYTAQTGLDPYLAVAIVLHETGCKWTCSTLVRECNNIGGIKGSPSCGGGSYKKYDTLEEGINGYLDLLYTNYYSVGLTTPELINPKYAASTTWSEKINNYMNSIRES